MLLRLVIVSTALLVFKVLCKKQSPKTEIRNGNIFPEKYIHPENYIPTIDDVDSYLNGLEKTVSFFHSEPNKTNINKATCLFFAKGILRRTILDNGHKMQSDHKTKIKHIMAMADYVLSHYFYYNSDFLRKHGKPDLEYEVIQMYKEDDIFARSLPDFNSNKLEKRIRSKSKINEYIEDMDGATLPKEKYVELVKRSSEAPYNIEILSSDICLSRVIRNIPPPANNMELHACKQDDYCMLNIHMSPSIAYSLSHRMLNILMYRSIRHCYWVSPEGDDHHLDILCSFMYREAVYAARRGFFARDMFLEHVGLCGMNGYKEFYRKHWFMKALQWIDEDGCIYEDRNFDRNRTVTIRNQNNINNAEKQRLIRRLKRTLKQQCHIHPMAVLILFLSNAVRYGIHYVKN